MNYKSQKTSWDDDNKQSRFITVYGSSYNVYYPNAYENPKWRENSLRKTTTEYNHYKVVISRQLKITKLKLFHKRKDKKPTTDV
jgi:hypothetical protein